MAEEIAKVTDDQVQSLRKGFEEKVGSSGADFCPEDLERVKTDDLWIRRFIAAQEMDVKDGLNMLYETCQWRKEFGVNELDHTKLKPKMIEKGSLFIRNKDNWGKNLLIFKAKNHIKGSDDMEDLKRFIVYYFERIERLANSDQISVIFDMKDTGWSNMDMDFIRYLITLLKSYYPYFVNYLMIFEMPWLLKSAWNIIKGWLPPKFVDRVKFVDKKTIAEFINRENQLVEWGGTDEYTYSFQPEIRSINKSKEIDTKPPPEIRRRKPVEAPMVSGLVETSDNNNKSNQELMQHHHSPPRQEVTRRENNNNRVINIEISKYAEVESTIILRQQAGEISGSFLVKSVAESGQLIMYKVKTINPEDFKVRPSVGILESCGQTKVNVTVHHGTDTRNLARAKFQVSVLLVPKGSGINDDNFNENGHDYTKLNTLWKSLERSSEKSIQQDRITVVLDSSVQLSPGSVSGSAGSLVTMSEEEMRRSLKEFENRLREGVKDDTMEAIGKIQYQFYIACMLFGIYLLFTLVYFGRNGNSTNLS